MITNLNNFVNEFLVSSLMLRANGQGGSSATVLAAHFAKRNTKFGSEKEKVQKPARIPPQTPPAGGKKAEAGQFHSPRKIVCPAESKLVFRIFVKKSSNINQKTPPVFTFCKIVRNCLGAKRLGMVFPRENPSIFEGERKRPLGNAEVPVRKHRENEVFRTNLFSFAFSERLSVFFFDCPKTNFKIIWTT